MIQRSAGVLAPVFSLAGKYGIGNIGDGYRFVDMLAQAGQTYWQILPIGPVDVGNSPYQSFSAFAGNPLYIDPEQLQKQGLLLEEEVEALMHPNDGWVRYGTFNRREILHRAYMRCDMEKLQAFAAKNEELYAYAFFMAIRGHLEGEPLAHWGDRLRMREPIALESLRDELEEEIFYQLFLQMCFFEQWSALKRYANERNIRILGDMPIYVSANSADVWLHPACFLLDGEGRPLFGAGVPPDYFSRDGQLWGNPLYDYSHMKEEGYAWWAARIKKAFCLFDALRIDHFRGFDEFWAVPAGAATAAEGFWMKGPGMELVDVIKSNAAGQVIAEDLGLLTEGVKTLLKESGFPGMRVLQFAFDGMQPHDYQPHRFPENCVAYTGTHDNDTTMGWLGGLPPEVFSYVAEYLNLRGERDGYGAIKAVLSSRASLAIVPIQDYLQLGSSARVNTPSTIEGNWLWRMKEDVPGEVVKRMGRMAKIYERI